MLSPWHALCVRSEHCCPAAQVPAHQRPRAAAHHPPRPLRRVGQRFRRVRARLWPGHPLGENLSNVLLRLSQQLTQATCCHCTGVQLQAFVACLMPAAWTHAGWGRQSNVLLTCVLQLRHMGSSSGAHLGGRSSSAHGCGFLCQQVLDFTDHVWAEYWSASQARWVHLDPCEDALDQPLLYEVRAASPGAHGDFPAELHAFEQLPPACRDARRRGSGLAPCPSRGMLDGKHAVSCASSNAAQRCPGRAR